MTAIVETSPRPRTRAAAPDAACAEAVELARSVAEETAGHPVGEHVGTQVDGERVLTHLFVANEPGYSGWHWAVTVARASRARNVTVDEVVLLPGPDALLAPQWVPWSERLQPGDLGVGDLLPTPEDDPRLVPAYADVDPDDEPVVFELGLGRPRVLSLIGRDDAVDRWYDGDRGPRAPIAQAAPAPCGTCGFYLPIAGALRLIFGVCANEYAPDDGRVVSADHGCGGHSEAVVVPSTPKAASRLVDDYSVEVVHNGAEHGPGSVDDEPESTEPFGHS